LLSRRSLQSLTQKIARSRIGFRWKARRTSIDHTGELSFFFDPVLIIAIERLKRFATKSKPHRKGRANYPTNIFDLFMVNHHRKMALATPRWSRNRSISDAVQDRVEIERALFRP